MDSDFLMQFCDQDRRKPDVRKPFSQGEYTWATNGHIMARVPRLLDVPENDDAPDAEKAWPKHDQGFRRPGILPTPTKSTTCSECYGRGREHDCPDCECICEQCNGTGKKVDIAAVHVGVVGVRIDYIGQILELPGVEIEFRQGDPNWQTPVKFRWNGGEGCVMPFRIDQYEEGRTLTLQPAEDEEP